MALEDNLRCKEDKSIGIDDVFLKKSLAVKDADKVIALERSVYSVSLVIKVLGQYRFEEKEIQTRQIGSFSRLVELGVSPYNIQKMKVYHQNKIYLTEQGVSELFVYFRKVRKIRRYKSCDISEKLRQLVE